jgi:hypothetical protein
MKSSGDLIASISLDMSDNNAGLISAEDVRHNMEDAAFSMNRIIASGDTDVVFPFFNDVRAKHDSVVGAKGRFIAESGVLFPNAPSNPLKLQVEPFLGVAEIDHNALLNLDAGDVHTQYYNISGVDAASNVLQGNMPVGPYWINASGYDDVGFKFEPRSSDGKTQNILTSGTFKFGDNSRIANAKGMAKAWLNFDASGVGLDNEPVIRSWHNISGISRLAPGKLKITFSSGTFINNNYVAIGTSNAINATGSQEDFDVNTVGLVLREGNDDDTGLRTITYLIQNKGGEYVDSEICDFVAYGYEPTETSGTVPTAVKDAGYTDP